MRYLSKSFVAFLIPAVEILPGVEHKGLSRFYMSELAICGREGEWKERWENTAGTIMDTYRLYVHVGVKWVDRCVWWDLTHKKTELSAIVSTPSLTSFHSLLIFISSPLYTSAGLTFLPSFTYLHLAGRGPVGAAAFI